MEIELYVEKNEWRVRIVLNGEVIFTSKGYQEAGSCFSAITHLREQIADAPIREIGTLD